jgi:hypothetical protein
MWTDRKYCYSFNFKKAGFLQINRLKCLCKKNLGKSTKKFENKTRNRNEMNKVKLELAQHIILKSPMSSFIIKLKKNNKNFF